MYWKNSQAVLYGMNSWRWKRFSRWGLWIRLPFSCIFLILMRRCPHPTQSLQLVAIIRLSCISRLGLSSQQWIVSVHCQKESTTLLPFSPLLSGFEENNFSSRDPLYMLHYCGFKLWLQGYSINKTHERAPAVSKRRDSPELRGFS